MLSINLCMFLAFFFIIVFYLFKENQAMAVRKVSIIHDFLLFFSFETRWTTRQTISAVENTVSSITYLHQFKFCRISIIYIYIDMIYNLGPPFQTEYVIFIVRFLLSLFNSGYSYVLLGFFN